MRFRLLILDILQHAAYPNLDASTAFFGVYDGHGGKDTILLHIILNAFSAVFFPDKIFSYVY